MSEHEEHRPPFINSLLELRAPLEAASLIPTMPLLNKAPKGDGQPVLVLPGFMTGDNATFILRRFLSKQGFVPYPWEQGRNPGLRAEFYDNLAETVCNLYRDHGRKVAIVGWSLGGCYARALAHRLPDHISQVITLGSPFHLSNRHNADEVGVSGPIVKLYERLNPNLAEDPFVNGEPVWETAPPTPSTAIYTQEDGIASWKYCIDGTDDVPQTENIRVMGSHIGLTHNPFVMYILAERLAQKDHTWERFDSKWFHKYLFYSNIEEDTDLSVPSN